MQIEIWSDFMCPYCYIGLQSLEAAIKELNLDSKLVFRAFELYPNETRTGVKFFDNMKEKYNIDDYEINLRYNRIEKYAEKVGLKYNMKDGILANTNFLHRVMKYAATVDKEHALEEELMKAVFIEGKDVSDLNVLKEKASVIGLDYDKAIEFAEILSTKALVLEDENMATALGIDVIPSYRLNEDEIVLGTLEKDEWIEKLKKYE